MSLPKTITNRFPVIHPFLLTLFPIFSLYASNADQVRPVEVLRPAVLGVLFVGALLLVLGMLLRDWPRAGLVTSLASLVFFNFGMVNRLLDPSIRGATEALAAAWLALFGLGAWWIIRKAPRGSGKHRPLETLTRTLNLTGAIALAFCLAGFAFNHVQTAQAAAAAAAESALVSENPPVEAHAGEDIPQTGSNILPGLVSTVTPYMPPDIYYIILDGYGRGDVLESIYGLDNGPFIDYLRERGFYVAEESHSNYPQTALSLASSLNFSYLQDQMQLDPESETRQPLTDLIQQNNVQRFLKTQGYRTVAFTNGFPLTEMESADEFHQPDEGMTNFEISLLSGSLGAVEWDDEMLEDYRARVRWTVEELEQVVQTGGPKFVFVHIILPHPPFVFYGDGMQRISLSGGDGSHFDGTQQEYVRGYRGQLQYTNALARRVIEYILDHSDREPAILLQGDHGPGSHLDWASQEDSCLWERFSILNAYYLPGIEDPGLYPGITPVNSFRVLLDSYFDARLGTLPDRAYFAGWDKPYDLSEVTGQVGDRCGK